MIVSSALRGICGPAPILLEATRLLIQFLNRLPSRSVVKQQILDQVTSQSVHKLLFPEGLSKLTEREQEEILTLHSTLLRFLLFWKSDVIRTVGSEGTVLATCSTIVEPILGYLHISDCSLVFRFAMKKMKSMTISSNVDDMKVVKLQVSSLENISRPSHFAGMD
jgi:hypothetical protein